MKFLKMSYSGRQGFSGFVLLVMLVACAMTSSCVSLKKYVYFKDLPDTFSNTVTIDEVTPFVEPKIEGNDILSITVQPMLQNITNNANSGNNSGNGNSNANANNLFPVDKNGNIEYPLIGFQKVAGLTTAEARNLIREQSKRFYVDPVVNVRITNFDITILGDVPKPGRITSPSEKLSILDALADVGDLNYSAKRDNILLIRSEGDQKICARYDITSKKIFQNPYYYLKQRDIIYVEPNKFKVQSSDQTFIRNLGILSSLISIASLLLVYKSIK